MLATLENWHKTTLGYLVFMVAEAVLSYIFASLAIPSAHTWEWFLAAILALGALHNFLLLIGKLINAIKHKSAGTRQN